MERYKEIGLQYSKLLNCAAPLSILSDILRYACCYLQRETLIQHASPEQALGVRKCSSRCLSGNHLQWANLEWNDKFQNISQRASKVTEITYVKYLQKGSKNHILFFL